MTERLSPAVIERTVYRCLCQEVESLKPGNVHRFAAGHDMTVADFLRSAEVTAPILAKTSLSAGERLLEAVRATRAAAGCNTNLGMLLLFVPLVMAVERPRRGALQQRLHAALQELDTTAEAMLYFEAIRVASPGGLGRVEEHDVNSRPEVGVLAAMCAAQHRDRIARQYTHDYEDLFGEPLVILGECSERWHSVEWSLVACYLSFLSQFHDSHIIRKYGEPVASEVRQQAEKISTIFIKAGNPEEAAPLLLKFDARLKAEGINPGTSADLAAACLFIHELETLLE